MAKKIRLGAMSLEETVKEVRRLKSRLHLTVDDIVEASKRRITKNTVVDILKSKSGAGERRLSVLQELVEQLREEEEGGLQLDIAFYHAIRKRMHIPEDQQRRMLSRHKGSFLCYRMNAGATGISVSYLQIFEEKRDGIPRFEQVLTYPAEKNEWGDEEEHINKHYGFVFSRAPHRLYFLNASRGNFREMIAIPSPHDGVRNLVGVLLTVGLPPASIPFAARVVMRHYGDKDFDELRAECGSFDASDSRFQAIRLYIENDVEPGRVLRTLGFDMEPTKKVRPRRAQ